MIYLGWLPSLSWFTMGWYSYPLGTHLELACLKWRASREEVHMVQELLPGMVQDSQLSSSSSKHSTKGNTLPPSQRSSRELLLNIKCISDTHMEDLDQFFLRIFQFPISTCLQVSCFIWYMLCVILNTVIIHNDKKALFAYPYGPYLS